MPSFNETLQNHAASRVGAPCFTGEWRETLNPTDREQFDAALADPSVALVAIFRTMKALGFKGGDSTVQRHRAGGCKCSRTN